MTGCGLVVGGSGRRSPVAGVSVPVCLTAGVVSTQAEVAARYAVQPVPPAASDKLGVALNVRTELVPLNGLRHRPENRTSGWYLWAGEVFDDDADFFKPIHHAHLVDWCPAALPYLALPPGWRFLIAPGYEDVWFDEHLLDND